MIQDNQKSFSRLQMLIDAVVIAAAYVVAWMIRFIGPFAYSAVRALAFEQYMFALIFIIPGYLLLYQAFTLYEPLHMQGRRLSRLIQQSTVLEFQQIHLILQVPKRGTAELADSRSQ